MKSYQRCPETSDLLGLALLPSMTTSTLQVTLLCLIAPSCDYWPGGSLGQAGCPLHTCLCSLCDMLIYLPCLGRTSLTSGTETNPLTGTAAVLMFQSMTSKAWFRPGTLLAVIQPRFAWEGQLTLTPFATNKWP